MLTTGKVDPVTVDVQQHDLNRRRRLRIAFLTMRDANDRRSWSGTPYFMAQALEKHCGDVLRIGPLQPFSVRVGKLMQKGIRSLTGMTYLYTHTTSLSKNLGKMAGKRLAEIACDVIVAPAGSCVLAHLETQVPIVYLSDTTLHLMIDYYSDFTNLFRTHVRMADQLERLAITKASQLVYPSSWAAESAVRDYQADPSKISIFPFGANMDSPPSRQDAMGRSQQDRCRLLFVGVDWERKGGDIAVETLVELERLGVKAELTVVGCRPTNGLSNPNVNFIPFLSKNDPQARTRLDALYKNSDFFILPTRAECFGIAFCEANAYGLPVLSTQTGGVGDIVQNGVNGFLFPLEARGAQYAACVREVYTDPANYQRLRVSSREQFEARLNWDAWGRSMYDVLWNAVLPSGSRETSDKEHLVRR
jgi:glycosyltransferase involved in cell wall biosynthesis